MPDEDRSGPPQDGTPFSGAHSNSERSKHGHTEDFPDSRSRSRPVDPDRKAEEKKLSTSLQALKERKYGEMGKELEIPGVTTKDGWTPKDYSKPYQSKYGSRKSLLGDSNLELSPSNSPTFDDDEEIGPEIPFPSDGTNKREVEKYYRKVLKKFHADTAKLFKKQKFLEEKHSSKIDKFNRDMAKMIAGKTDCENKLKQITKEIRGCIATFQQTEIAQEKKGDDIENTIIEVKKLKDKRESTYFNNFLEAKMLHETSCRIKKKSKKKIKD